MKSLALFFIFLILGFALTYFLIAKKTTSKIVQPSVTQVVPPSKFSLEKAPTASLYGDITSMSGKIKWQSRTATESSVITKIQKIQQGESLETGDDGRVNLAFPHVALTLQPQTTLNVIQTLPQTIVFEQKTGEIIYEDSAPSPIAVRISPVLIQMSDCTCTITKDDTAGTIAIAAVKGSATVAYNDSDNVSTVEKVQAGKTLTFDLSTRTSRIK